MHYITDGSLDSDTSAVGTAFICYEETALFSLSAGCTVLQAELLPIVEALHNASLSHHHAVVIHSDSQTALQAPQTALQALPHMAPCDNVQLVAHVLSLLLHLRRAGCSVVLY